MSKKLIFKQSLKIVISFLFFQTYFSRKSETRRKLILRVTPASKSIDENNDEINKDDDEKYVKIKNIMQFKTGLKLFPLVETFNNTPRKGIIMY